MKKSFAYVFLHVNSIIIPTTDGIKFNTNFSFIWFRFLSAVCRVYHHCDFLLITIVSKKNFPAVQVHNGEFFHAKRSFAPFPV